jgi:serine/threonine protein kinase
MSEDQMPADFVAPDSADLAPLFPGYEIQGLIATGGMGAVYGAVQKSLERAVAIKILPQEFTRDEAFRAGFEAEAKAMARLNHPNLIGVYDFGEVAGMLYIIMEYVPGQSLHHSAHGIAIDPSEVIRLVTGICHGLAHAHQNGIIHRDIKPSNILLDLNANPKIGDFGLARPADRQIQAGEEIFGTPHYTAPEVVAAPSAVDHRADIFSVGVLLHELLTGRLPADDHRTASAISMCDPRFDAIIRRATDLMPDRRYASALEIVEELHTIATTAGPKVLRTAPAGVPPEARHRKGKVAASAKKSSSAPLVVIILIAAAVAVLALKYYSDRNHAPENPIAETPPPAAVPEAPVLPEPEPEPVVEIPAPPIIPPEPELVILPEPEPEPPEPQPQAIEPKSDVAAFLDRARGIMRKRAEPLINSHDLNLQKNTDSWARALRRAIRKIDLPGVRGNAEVALKEFLDLHENDGNRLPPALNPYLTTLPPLVETHEEFIEKQKELERAVVNELSTLSATYILGIEKQIERLKAGNDPGAIELLEKEIELVREDPEYFPELMLDPADQ